MSGEWKKSGFDGHYYLIKTNDDGGCFVLTHRKCQSGFLKALMDDHPQQFHWCKSVQIVPCPLSCPKFSTKIITHVIFIIKKNHFKIVNELRLRDNGQDIS